MGAKRRQHHAAVQAQRDAAAQVAAFEEQQRQFQEQLRLQREAMLQQTKEMRLATAPKMLQSTAGATRTGVKAGASKKKTASALGAGASSLKIPLNLGAFSGSGLNIP